jgi:glutamine amidotransferase PdxT
MILLSNSALNQAEGGQSLLGGLDVVVCRNYFGSQVSWV